MGVRPESTERRGRRWWEAAPEVVLAVGLGTFAVLELDAARAAFRSSTALVLMAAIAAAWVIGRVVLARLVDLPWLRLAVFSLAAFGILRVVVFSAYDDTTVIEVLEVAERSAPQAPSSTVPPSVPVPITVPAPDPVPTTATPPAEPVALRSAPLDGIDHRASGTVVLYRQPDGSLVVGLEGIDVQPGPDYDVYVVPGADQQGVDGGVRLDDLRGNQGTQYYEVPPGTDVAVGPWTLLVWCETFDVPVAGATPV